MHLARLPWHSGVSDPGQWLLNKRLVSNIDSLHFRRDVQACAMWAGALSAFTLVHPGTQTCAPCGHLRRHAGAVT